MTYKEKLALIFRLTSGYTIIGDYIIDTAGDALVNESLAVYSQSLYKNRFENLLTQEQAKDVLIINSLWKFDDDNNLIELDKSLDNCKLELYNNYGMPASVIQQIRNRLAIIKDKKNEKLNIKHSLDKFTLEGLAEYSAELYMFSKLILDRNYQPVSLPVVQVEKLIGLFKAAWPSNTDLRQVARTEPWRSFWSANPNCFRVFGDEQKVLIMLSKMYDNVYEHSERPCDDIINDDDMLDGWYISMHRKAQAEKAKSTQNILTAKHPRAQEIFVSALSYEDARANKGLTETQLKEIAAMNDPRAQIIKKQISTLVQEKPIVRDLDIPIVRLEVQNG